jgi:hypothetical protein
MAAPRGCRRCPFGCHHFDVDRMQKLQPGKPRTGGCHLSRRRNSAFGTQGWSWTVMHF